MRVRIVVEYDGRPFVGWQRQANGQSVQGAIEAAAEAVCRHPVTVHAAGRTDAGVHARGMVAHLDTDRPISPFRLMEGINALVRPLPVSVVASAAADADFHARFSCVARHYQYQIINRRPALALDIGRAWRITRPLDDDAMQKAANILVGRHDFTTFRSAHCQAASPIKTLDRLEIVRSGERITVHASARSFLHHQVRSMVGCLALVGEGKWACADMRAALTACDRNALGFNAPPDGLYFMRADY